MHSHTTDSHSCGDMSDSEILTTSKFKRKRKVKDGSNSASDFRVRHVKSKQRHLSWFLPYVENPSAENVNWLKYFRRRFCAPCCKHKEILCDLKDQPLFSQWWDDSFSWKGSSSIYLEFLSPGESRCLDRGWTLDDVSESFGISISVLSVFFWRILLLLEVVNFTKTMLTFLQKTKRHCVMLVNARWLFLQVTLLQRNHLTSFVWK